MRPGHVALDEARGKVTRDTSHAPEGRGSVAPSVAIWKSFMSRWSCHADGREALRFIFNLDQANRPAPTTPSGAVRLRVTAGEGKRHHAAAARRQPRRHGCRWQGERRKTQALIETAHHTQAGGHGPMPSITRPADTATTSPSSRGRQVSPSPVSGTLASITISWKPGATVNPSA